jgi:hypothetical protein
MQIGATVAFRGLAADQLSKMEPKPQAGQAVAIPVDYFSFRSDVGDSTLSLASPVPTQKLALIISSQPERNQRKKGQPAGLSGASYTLLLSSGFTSQHRKASSFAAT